MSLWLDRLPSLAGPLNMFCAPPGMPRCFKPAGNTLSGGSTASVARKASSARGRHRVGPPCSGGDNDPDAAADDSDWSDAETMKDTLVFNT